MNVHKRPFLSRLMALWMLLGTCMGSCPWALASGKMDANLERTVSALSDDKDLTDMPGVFYKEGEPYVEFFVRLSGLSPELERLGVDLRSRSADIYTASAPLEAIRQVADLPEVQGMEGVVPVEPVLNVSVPDIGGDLVWEQPTWGNRGEGVLVGVVDSGLSLDHVDVKDEFGQTRIQFLWDMSDSQGPPPSPGTCGLFSGSCKGTECSHADILAGTCRQKDQEKHGTAVMGVLAGNGQGGCSQLLASGPCSGVAPRALLGVVKMDEQVTSEVADGIAYLFKMAEALDLPAVVNLSVVWFQGPRDGTSMIEQFITGLTGPGKIVVSAAGNEGNMQGHAEATLDSGNGWRDLARSRLDGTTRGLGVEIYGWYDVSGLSEGQSVRVRVLQTTNDTVVVDWVGVGETGSGATSRGNVTVDHSEVSPTGGGTVVSRGFRVHLDVPSGVSSTLWSVEVEGQGFAAGDAPLRVDFWINPLLFPRPPDPFTDPEFRFVTELGAHTDDERRRRTIVPPCTADDVICASSYNSACDVAGYCLEGLGDGLQEQQGTFSGFSSRGPRRDGDLKPELGAPGQAIQLPVPGENDYAYASGTSFAAPHVAGTIALMLNRDRELGPARAAQALMDSARSWATESWNDDQRGRRGAGRLDAFGATEAIPSTGPGRPRELSAQVINFDKVRLTWKPPQPIGDVVLYRVFSDRASGTIDYTAPIAEVQVPTTTWLSPALSPGSFLFGVRSVDSEGQDDGNTSVVAGALVLPKPKTLGAGDDFCFIATAVFGDLHDPRVTLLREFRDRFLLVHPWGRAFVRAYYAWSPPVAGWLKERPVCSAMVRVSLLPVVGAAEVLSHRPNAGWAVLLLASTLLAGLVAVRRRRRIPCPEESEA